MSTSDEWDGREVMRGTGQFDAELGPVRLEMEWTVWTAGHGPLGRFWHVRGCVGGRTAFWGGMDYDVGRRLRDEAFFDDEVGLGLRAGFDTMVDEGRVRTEVHARPTTSRQQRILRDVFDACGGRAPLTALPSGALTLCPGYRWWAVSPELLGWSGCNPVTRRIRMARRGVISEVAQWILDGASERVSGRPVRGPGAPRIGARVGPARLMTTLGARRLRLDPGVGLLEEGLDGLQRAFSVTVGDRWLVDGQMPDKAFWGCVGRGVFDGPVRLLASAPLGRLPDDGLLPLEFHISGTDEPMKAILEDLVREHGAGVRHQRLVDGDVALSLGQRAVPVARAALTSPDCRLPRGPVGLRAFGEALNPILHTLSVGEGRA